MKLFTEINAACQMPIPFLEEQWAITARAVKGAYSLTEDSPTFFPTVMGAFKKVVQKHTSHKEQVDKFFKEMILAEIVNPKPPTAKLIPNGINPDAIPLWVALFKSKRQYIAKYKDNVEKWAAAIVFFKRMCAKKGIQPFQVGHTTPQAPALMPLRNQITKSVDLLNSAHDILIDLGHAKKASKPVAFVSIQKDGSDSIVTLRKELALKVKHNAFDSLTALRKKMRLTKDGPKRNSFTVTQGQKVTLLFSIKKKAGLEIIVTILVSVPQRIVKKIEVIDKPTTFFKKWAKKKFATASVISNYDEAVRDRFVFETPEDLFRMLSAIDLQFVVEAGDQKYQIAMVKHLISEAQRFNSDCVPTFHEFLNNPDYRKEIQEKFTIINDETDEVVIGPGA